MSEERMSEKLQFGVYAGHVASVVGEAHRQLLVNEPTAKSGLEKKIQLDYRKAWRAFLDNVASVLEDDGCLVFNLRRDEARGIARKAMLMGKEDAAPAAPPTYSPF